jgi:hypothetical protein
MRHDTAWTDYPQSPFNVNWEHPDGWRAEICLTYMGQFSARLIHPVGSESFGYDHVLIEPAHGHQYEQQTADALAQFDAWIAQHGPEALGDLPVKLHVTRREAHALQEHLPALLDILALSEQSVQILDLRAALIRIAGQVGVKR